MSGPVLASSRGLQLRPPLCWPLLPVPGADGRLRFPDLETSVRDRIEAVLRTSPGEQLMRPDFGAGLERALHQPDSPGTRARITGDIAAALTAWEPRISLDAIDVDSGADPSLLLVTISYRIRQTGVATTLAIHVPVGEA